MEAFTFADKPTMGVRAADDGAEKIRNALQERGSANIVVATGASQFEMLSHLVSRTDIPWHLVNAFHLDEYVNLPVDHPGSFRLYLWQRFVSRLPVPLKRFHYINAEVDPAGECQRLSQLIQQHPIDVAFVGIGENGHLAFNDPPADFVTEVPYRVVELDEACRRQQYGEGWFDSMESVPGQAITMSIRQIMKSRHIICTVPDKRKAPAVRDALEGPVTPKVPASILQQHPSVNIYLDEPAASLCERRVGSRQ